MKAIFKTIFATLLILALMLQACSSPPAPSETATNPPVSSIPHVIPVFKYKIINTYPHDRSAFTEGLVFENGFLYEGTGRIGHSSLRKVALNSGTIVQSRELPAPFFGEGITIYNDNDKIIQLTWQSHTGFVYDKSSFEPISQFSYPTEAWGITTDGKRLIMSDGTSTLHFLDPETFLETGNIEVNENKSPVTKLNELEWVKGKIYANVWLTDRIAIIAPETGEVTGWIDLKGLKETQGESADVLNGIAYDARDDRLFVTGKLWQTVFEIVLVAE